jgi:ferritin
MQEALSFQIGNEFHAAYLYFGMAAHFDEEGLSGCASWMKKQAQEEINHGMRIYDFIIEREGHVTLPQIEAVATSYSSALEAFQTAYGHEQKVTKMIDGLLEKAQADKDHATEVMLNWFVDEQVEEEASTKAIVDKLEMIGDNKEGLLMLDAELGKREE